MSIDLKREIIRNLDGTTLFAFKGKMLRHNSYSLDVMLSPGPGGTDITFELQITGMVEMKSYRQKLFDDVQVPLLAVLREALRE